MGRVAGACEGLLIVGFALDNATSFPRSGHRDGDVDCRIHRHGPGGILFAMTYAYRDADEAPVPVTAVISMVGPASFDPRAWFGIDDGFASDKSAEAGAAFVSIITGDAISPDMMRSGEYQTHLRNRDPALSQELGRKIEEYLRTYAPLGPAS